MLRGNGLRLKVALLTLPVSKILRSGRPMENDICIIMKTGNCGLTKLATLRAPHFHAENPNRKSNPALSEQLSAKVARKWSCARMDASEPLFSQIAPFNKDFKCRCDAAQHPMFSNYISSSSVVLGCEKPTPTSESLACERIKRSLTSDQCVHSTQAVLLAAESRAGEEAAVFPH